MQFVVLVKATADGEAGVFRREQFIEMGAFNDQLAKDGVLLAAEGLQPSSKGVRLRFDEGRTTVTDGPFTETTASGSSRANRRMKSWSASRAHRSTADKR